jgi:hypothetical protein
MTRSHMGLTCVVTRLWSRTRLNSLAWACLAGLALFAAACGGSSSGSAGGTTSTSDTSTSNSETSVVLGAYRAEQAAFEQAFLTANPSLPALAETMVNPQLQLVERNLLGEQHGGTVGKGNVALHPHVESITRTQAVVEDCLYSTQELVYAATGQPVPPATPPQHDGVRSTLTQVSPSTWKVAEQSVIEGHCPPGY